MSWIDFLGALVGQVFIAGAIYGGIRADLKALGQRVAEAQAIASRAHRRIDDLMLQDRKA